MTHQQSRFSGQQPLVLLAEDDCEMRRLISRALKKDGYEVVEVADRLAAFPFPLASK